MYKVIIEWIDGYKEVTEFMLLKNALGFFNSARQRNFHGVASVRLEQP